MKVKRQIWELPYSNIQHQLYQIKTETPKKNLNYSENIYTKKVFDQYIRHIFIKICASVTPSFGVN